MNPNVSLPQPALCAPLPCSLPGSPVAAQRVGRGLTRWFLTVLRSDWGFNIFRGIPYCRNLPRKPPAEQTPTFRCRGQRLFENEPKHNPRCRRVLSARRTPKRRRRCRIIETSSLVCRFQGGFPPSSQNPARGTLRNRYRNIQTLVKMTNLQRARASSGRPVALPVGRADGAAFEGFNRPLPLTTGRNRATSPAQSSQSVPVLEKMSCRMSGRRVTIPEPRGRKSLQGIEKQIRG